MASGAAQPANITGEQIDFFISHAGADAAWGQWIAWQLEAKGYHAIIQD